MNSEADLIRWGLRTPRGAAIAGILFPSDAPVRNQNGRGIHDLDLYDLVTTGIVPRWTAFLGFALDLTLLLSNGTINGILLVFPLWVLSIRVHILIDNCKGDLNRTTLSNSSTPCHPSYLPSATFEPHNLLCTSSFLQVAVAKAPRTPPNITPELSWGRFRYSPRTSRESGFGLP